MRTQFRQFLQREQITEQWCVRVREDQQDLS